MTTTTLTQTHINELLAVASDHNHFEPQNVIWILDSFRTQGKLTLQFILALIAMDIYETPNIYPYLQDCEKRLPMVTENAISRWKWNAAWSPDLLFEPLAQACCDANQARDSFEARWLVGYYSWSEKSKYTVPAIALVAKSGIVLQSGITRETAISHGAPLRNESIKNAVYSNSVYQSFVHTEDEKIASINRIWGPFNPVAEDSFDFKIGSMSFWKQDFEGKGLKFVRHRIQYTPQQAARIILNSPITWRYLRSFGGPIERAWHPTNGLALQAYTQKFFSQ